LSVSTEEIENIANLARLNLNENEKEKLKGQVNQILEYVKKLNELNTDDIEPLSHTLELTNVFRKDEVQESLSQHKALLNAPVKSDQFFRVPKVIKK
jgi:aspartyl-tRNA(Asn)/glutamyl-tRNA(Gln) amidotransferase subunit C